MEFMIEMGRWIARVMDYPLGWLLLLPRDLAVVLVALGTSVILTLARRWTTDQDMMRRCKEDLDRLGVLRKQAKKAKDKLQVTRIATSVAMINLKRMKAEGWGVLASLLPIILLASWAFERLDYYPTPVGQEVELRVTYPARAINHLTMLTADPSDTVVIEPDAVQQVREDDNIDPCTGQKLATDVQNGLATWKIKGLKPAHEVKLNISYDSQRIVHPLRIGKRSYEAQLVAPADAWTDCSSQVILKRALFLDWVPGMPAFWGWYLRTANEPSPPPLDPKASWGDWFKHYFLFTPYWLVTRLTWFAPWLFAYLIIVIPFVPLLRRVIRVY